MKLPAASFAITSTKPDKVKSATLGARCCAPGKSSRYERRAECCTVAKRTSNACSSLVIGADCSFRNPSGPQRSLWSRQTCMSGIEVRKKEGRERKKQIFKAYSLRASDAPSSKKEPQSLLSYTLHSAVSPVDRRPNSESSYPSSLSGRTGRRLVQRGGGRKAGGRARQAGQDTRRSKRVAARALVSDERTRARGIKQRERETAGKERGAVFAIARTRRDETSRTAASPPYLSFFMTGAETGRTLTRILLAPPPWQPRIAPLVRLTLTRVAPLRDELTTIHKGLVRAQA